MPMMNTRRLFCLRSHTEPMTNCPAQALAMTRASISPAPDALTPRSLVR